MKICGIICEYNPFHNGHAYLLSEAKKQSGADALLCIMSGNFTQRGEMAVLDKFTRAKHAVLAGADAVIELPAVFAISPAEIFAKGAVKLLASCPSFDTLAFGCEDGDRISFLQTAKATADESRELKAAIRANLKAGMSLTKARHEAIAAAHLPNADASLLSSPNNILGIEYTKALLHCNSPAQILPVKRIGGGYSDPDLLKNFSSATAIRGGVAEGKFRAIKKNVPPFVFADLKKATFSDAYKKIAVYKALFEPAENLKKILDCTEGLENRIKALARGTSDYDALVAKITTKRYISSRIRRILAAAVLGIDEDLVRQSLKTKLYLKVLAVKKERADGLFSELKRAEIPLLTRKSDENDLSPKARQTFEKDILANDLYNFMHGIESNEHRTLFV